MIGILETCECGREFLRGIYPQKKCEACDAMPPDEPQEKPIPSHPLNNITAKTGGIKMEVTWKMQNR